MRTLLAAFAIVVCLHAQGKVDPKYAPLANQLFTAAGEPARVALLDAHADLANADLIKTMNEMAGQVFDRRDNENALAMYTVSCAAATRIGDRYGQANCLYDSGLCLSNLYRAAEAMTYFNRAIAIYRELGKRADTVRVLNGIGVNLMRSGNLNAAQPYLQQAVEAASSGDFTDQAMSNLNLGNLYKSIGRYRDAIQCYRVTLDLIRDRPGMENRVGMVLNNLGGAYFDQGEVTLALSYHEQGLALKEKSHAGANDLGTSVLNIGVDYMKMHAFDKAASYYDRALQLTESSGNLRTRALVMYNYGTLLRESGHPTDGKARLEATLAITDRTSDMDTASAARVELGEIAVDQDRYSDAVAIIEPAIAFGREVHSPNLLSRALDVLGLALRGLGRIAEAEAALAEAIRITEQLRAELPGEQQNLAAFLNDRVSPYLHMIVLQIEQHHDEAALEYAEISKGRALLDVLHQGHTAVNKAMNASERAQEAELTGRLAALNEMILQESRRDVRDRKRIIELSGQLDKARTEYRSFEVALYAAHPQLQVQRADFAPVKVSEMLASAPNSRTALLEYAITDAGTFLFVVTSGGSAPRVRVYRLSDRRHALEQDINRFREQIATRDLDYRTLAMSLYQRLLAPAEEQLRGATTLVIVPDGVLWQLPFQALQPKPDRYVVDDRAVFYTPSLSVLHEIQRTHPTTRLSQPRILAVNAARVASAQRELTGLRQVYGADRVRVYGAAEADEDNLKREAPHYDILQFTAHGVFENRNPMDSYLVLAKDGKPEAGVLQARDMMDLDLRADMVVLSGCETGRGSATGGEGLIGMSWALFIAGSPATIASQWKVESESTSRFMIEFHRTSQRESKVAALRQAALHVRNTPAYSHPFYWSGFILMGNGF